MSMTIGSYVSTFDYSSLFNTSQKNSSASGANFSTAGIIGLASDYSTISKGSYGKLLNSYYKKMGELEHAAGIESESKNRQLVAGNAKNLGTAAKDLKGMDFSEASKEDSLKAVKSFVSAYNSLVDTADDVDSKAVLRNASWMTTMMSERAGLLSDVGITIGTDNKLTLDETKWEASDATSKSSLFSGRSGLAEKLLYKADRIGVAASRTVSNTASAYTSNGDYASVTPGSLYEAWL